MFYRWVLNECHRKDFLRTLEVDKHHTSTSDVLVDNSSPHSNFQWKLGINMTKNIRKIQLTIFLVRADQFESFRADYEIKVFVSGSIFCHYENKSLFDMEHKKSHTIESLSNIPTEFLKLDQSILSQLFQSVEIRFHVNVTSLDSVSNIFPALQEIPDFEKLLDDPKFSDFTIISSEKEFKVHKNILAARSEVFSTMFEIDMKEKNEGKATIEDFSLEVVQELLRFMYCGKVKDLDRLSTDLFKAAHMYSIRGLSDLCLESMCKSLHTRNAVQLLSMAINYKAEVLKSKIINFIVLNMKEVSQCSNFRTLVDPSVLHEIINKTVCMWL